jgi:two-component system OmpR family sensor kinase
MSGSSQTRYPGRIGRRLVLVFVAFVMVVVGGTGWTLYDLTAQSLERQMTERLVAVTELVADGTLGDLVSAFRPGDESFPSHTRLRGRLRDTRDLVDGRRIYIFDKAGRSLLDTEDVPIGREYVRLRIDRKEVEEAWRGMTSHSVLFRDQNAVYYKTGYAPLWSGDDVAAVLAVEIGAGFMGAIEAFSTSVLIFGIVSAVLTVVIGLALARSLTRPIDRLVKSARQIGRGVLDEPVGVQSNNELGYLGSSMDDMRLQILARDEQLRLMLAGVAHEIRNPLGGIEIYAGLIAADLTEEDPRKAHIEKVIQEVRTLNRVISEFLDFARPNVSAPSDVHVAQLVEEVVFLLAPEMEQAGVRCTRDIPDALTVSADEAQLKRAIINLVKNGVQAMENGGELHIEARSNNDEGTISVMDTGEGIEESLSRRLFEPFFTTREKGSGLGLAIVQKTMESNGGRVEVRDRSGSGTQFNLVLPSARED